MTTESQVTDYKKPLPRLENPTLTQPFWDAAKRHELVVQRCRNHNGFFWPPRELCPVCLSTNLEWAPVSGKGHVYSFTVVYQAGNPAFADDAPHVFAHVQLDEGPRLSTNIVGCPADRVEVDMAVTVQFDDVTPDWTLVKFRPT